MSSRASMLEAMTPRVDRLYRLEARFTEWTAFGPVPEGLRLNAHFEGRVTDGELVGATVRGIDYVLLRPDGVGILDVRELLTLDGVTIDIHPAGYMVPPAGFSMPEPQRMLSPDFVWPDVELPLHGFATLRTAAPEWRWLNESVGLFIGAANPGAETLVIDAYLFRPGGSSAR